MVHEVHLPIVLPERDSMCHRPRVLNDYRRDCAVLKLPKLVKRSGTGKGTLNDGRVRSGQRIGRLHGWISEVIVSVTVLVKSAEWSQ